MFMKYYFILTVFITFMLLQFGCSTASTPIHMTHSKSGLSRLPASSAIIQSSLDKLNWSIENIGSEEEFKNVYNKLIQLESVVSFYKKVSKITPAENADSNDNFVLLQIMQDQYRNLLMQTKEQFEAISHKLDFVIELNSTQIEDKINNRYIMTIDKHIDEIDSVTTIKKLKDLITKLTELPISPLK